MIKSSKKHTFIPLPDKMWSEYIYANLCVQYLYGNLSKSIETMEEILLLIQIDSLQEFQESLFDNTIFFNEEQVYISYLSELLRVMPVKVLSNAANNGYLNSNILERVDKNFKMYSKMSDLEIKKKAQEVLLKNNLDKKLFIYSKDPFSNYQNNLSKKTSRIFAYCTEHVMKGLLKMVVGILGGMTFGLLIFAIMISVLFPSIMDKAEGLFELSLYTLPFTIIWILWNYSLMKPNEFEIKNGYIKKLSNK